MIAFGTQQENDDFLASGIGMELAIHVRDLCGRFLHESVLKVGVLAETKSDDCSVEETDRK